MIDITELVDNAKESGDAIHKNKETRIMAEENRIFAYFSLIHKQGQNLFTHIDLWIHT